MKGSTEGLCCYNRHLGQSVQISRFIKAEFFGLTAKKSQVGLFDKELPDKSIGEVFSFNYYRGSCISEAIQASVM